MLFAKTPEAAVHLRRQFEEHSVRKTYMARVRSADYAERPRQKVDFKQGKPAHTEYQVMKEHHDGTADLLLRPLTGRTHQLRVHAAHPDGLNCPIVGDPLYGQPSDRLYLHAERLEFKHPVSGKYMHIQKEAPF